MSAGDGSGPDDRPLIAVAQYAPEWRQVALNRDLSQFERIKKIALLPAEFSIQSGELTPTLKVKRKVIEERWRDQIEALYAEPT